MDVRHAVAVRPRAGAHQTETALLAGCAVVALLVTALPTAWAVMLSLGALGVSVSFVVAAPVGLVVALVPFAVGTLLRRRSDGWS